MLFGVPKNRGGRVRAGWAGAAVVVEEMPVRSRGDVLQVWKLLLHGRTAGRAHSPQRSSRATLPSPQLEKHILEERPDALAEKQDFLVLAPSPRGHVAPRQPAIQNAATTISTLASLNLPNNTLPHFALFLF